VTYRYRGHSMADPEEYRSKEEVEEWRERDPINAFSKRLVDEGVLSQSEVENLDAEAIEIVDEAQRFADESPFPDLDSLYDDVYVFSDDVPAWWTVDERSPEVHRGEREREAGELPHELAEKGAAYAGVGDHAQRTRRAPKDQDEEGDQQGPGEEDEDEGQDGEVKAEDEGQGQGDEVEAEGEDDDDRDDDAEAGAEASGTGEPEADERDETGGGG